MHSRAVKKSNTYLIHKGESNVRTDYKEGYTRVARPQCFVQAMLTNVNDLPPEKIISSWIHIKGLIYTLKRSSYSRD